MSLFSFIFVPVCKPWNPPKKCPWFHSVHRIGDPVDAAVKNNSEICRNTKQIQRGHGQHPSRQDNVLLLARILFKRKLLEEMEEINIEQGKVVIARRRYVLCTMRLI